MGLSPHPDRRHIQVAAEANKQGAAIDDLTPTQAVAHSATAADDFNIGDFDVNPTLEFKHHAARPIADRAAHGFGIPTKWISAVKISNKIVTLRRARHLRIRRYGHTK